MTLNDVFGVFTSSTSTLQYILADLEREFFRTAVTETLAGARKLMLAQTEVLATEQRRIAGQDLLDSIEDRADDEDLAKRLDQIDARSGRSSRRSMATWPRCWGSRMTER